MEIKDLNKQGLKNVLRQLMHTLNYPKYIGNYIYDNVRFYPQVNSMSALNYALTKFGIENEGVALSLATLEKEVTLPAIVHLMYNGGIFVVVKQINPTNICIATEGKDICISKKDFQALFTGNCIVLDTEAQIEINRKAFIQWLISEKSKILLLFTFISFILTLLFVREFNNIIAISFLALYILGLGVCVFMFTEQLGIESKVTKAICNGSSSRLNCNSILSSEAGKLWGILAWSDIGIIYFSTLLITTLLWGFQIMWPLLVIISFITLPYIFYSIYFQWRIAKIWCPLCLVVQSIFFIQALLSTIELTSGKWLVETKVVTLCIITGLLISSGWFVIKSMIINTMKYKYIKSDFNKYKHQPWIYSIVTSGIKYNVDNVNQIYISKEGKNVITFVFSPLCGPCISQINQLIEIINRFDVNLRLIFVRKEQYQGEDTSLISYFLEEYDKSSDRLVDALKKYADNRSIMRLKLSKYKPTSKLQNWTESIIGIHHQWYESNGFIGTPVILLNEIQLPSNYLLDDLEFIIHKNN